MAGGRAMTPVGGGICLVSFSATQSAIALAHGGIKPGHMCFDHKSGETFGGSVEEKEGSGVSHKTHRPLKGPPGPELGRGCEPRRSLRRRTVIDRGTTKWKRSAAAGEKWESGYML